VRFRVPKRACICCNWRGEPMQLSDAERLTLLMLCDIYEKLGITDSFDPAFVRKTIMNGDTWALDWAYAGLSAARETTEDQVHDVTEILEMWDRIERSYERLDADGQERVKQAHRGYPPTFSGFDGNHETTEIGVADLLVNDMNRWERFKGRDLNAHMPTRDMHRRMLEAFGPYKSVGQLMADQLVELLNAQIHRENR
jgi:uncharacterized protein